MSLDSLNGVLNATNLNYTNRINNGYSYLDKVYETIINFAKEMGKVNNISDYIFGKEYMGNAGSYPGLKSTDYYKKMIREKTDIKEMRGRAL